MPSGTGLGAGDAAGIPSVVDIVQITRHNAENHRVATGGFQLNIRPGRQLRCILLLAVFVVDVLMSKKAVSPVP